MKAKLKPCPFCGGEAKVVCYAADWYMVGCESPGCLGFYGNCRPWSKEEWLISAWNRRVSK